MKDPKLETEILNCANSDFDQSGNFAIAYAVLSLRDSLESHADKLAHSLYQIAQSIRPEL